MSTHQARGRARTKSIEKRQRILDATARLIAQRSTLDITLHEVGNEVGIYAASIYYYFPSREDLIREVHAASLARFRSTIAEAIDGLPEGSTPLDRLRQAILTLVQLNTSADDYALAYTRVLEKVIVPAQDDIRLSRRAIRELWLDLLRDAQDAGQLAPSVDIALLRFFIVGALHWVSYWYRPDGPRSAGEIVDAYFDVLMNGAGPR